MAGDFTQYSSAAWLSTAASAPLWVPEDQKERINSYTKYEELYWNDERSLQLMRRGTEMQPILVPNPKLICDTTSHFLLKGLQIGFQGKVKDAWIKFSKREKFYSKFMVAKHSGVVRGDYILHLTADPTKPEGKRVCINSVDPASYFPVYDPDDLDSVIAVHLVEAFMEGQKSLLRRKTYREVPQSTGENRISVSEVVVRTDVPWYEVDKLPIERTVLAEQLLPPEITAIPVYHFKNIDWQGQPFGSSELRGFERIIAGISQTISDEELALALEGLGVYATDAGRPKDAQGNEVDWVIGPGIVEEVPTGAFFKRVEGIKSVTPMLDHVNYLDKKLMTASATFDAANIDVQVAQSGIALAIHFLPQQAKMEERELEGQDTLAQFAYDWCSWQNAYEGTSFSENDAEAEISLGDKLPLNREERVAELNNMFDRKIITSDYYRQEMEKLGYVFPDDMDKLVMDEQMQKFEMAQKQAIMNGTLNPDGTPVLKSGNPSNPNEPSLPPPGNQSNNAGKTNESNGTEAKQSLSRQTKAGR